MASFYPDLDALDAAAVDTADSADTSTPDDSSGPTTDSQTIAPLTAPISSQPSLYIDSNDVMVFTVWNSNTALTSLALVLRIQTPDGQILIAELSLPALTSDRMPNVVQMNMQEGFLVSAMVSGVGAATSRGQCFASAKMNRGGQVNPPAVFNLFSDYVTTGNFPQWPNGRNISGLDGPGFITTYAFGPVAAGQQINVVVPAGVRWRVVSWASQFTAGPGAGNRTPTFFLSSELPAAVFILTAQNPLGAANVIDYFLSAGLPVYSAFAGIQLMPIPIDLHVDSGYNFFSQTVGMQGADQWTSCNLIVEEWLDV